MVGAGDGPCVVVAAGARRPGSKVIYPHNEVAEAHGASVLATTDSGQEAYARFPEAKERPYREGDLPDW